MIKNIFIPEKIGDNYLFSQKILGFDIGKSFVRAAVLRFTGKTKIIENLFEEIIDLNSDATYQEKVSNAIKNIVNKAGKVDKIYTSLSSSLVIFKELKLSLIGTNKIKLILPFELEGQLPFSIDQAVLDSVIVDEDVKEKNSTVLVAAVKKEIVDEHLAMFLGTGVTPDKITVDLFEIYGLYKATNHTKNSDSVALLEIGIYSTNIILINNNKLKYIRTLPKGLSSISKNIASILKLDQGSLLENILRFGLEGSDNTQFDSQVKEKLTDLLNEVNFTLENYTSRNRIPNVSKIIIFGQSQDIKGLKGLISEILVPAEIIDLKSLFNKPIQGQYEIAVATAFSSSFTENFNLLRESSLGKENRLLNKQLISVLILFLLIILSFYLHSFLTYRKLKNEIYDSEKQAINLITKKINIDKKRGGRKLTTLKEAIDAARATLEKEESIWFSLSSKNRYSFLKYLHELTTKIDRESIGLELKKLRIYNVNNSTKIDLEGKVKDFDAINSFESQLKSGMFEGVPRIETPDFDITLVVKKED